MAGDSGSKTEKASPKKRRDERKKGNVFQSKDIVTVFQILLLFLTVKIMMPFIYSNLSAFMEKMFSKLADVQEITITLAMDLFKDAVVSFILVAGPMLLMAMLVGVLASGIQTKFLISFEALKFKFSKLSIFKGIKRMFSMRSVVELLKSLIKVSLIAIILYLDFQEIAVDFSRTMSIDLMSSIVFILDAVMDMVIKVVLAFAALSLFDYLYQWWDYENKLKMSKQEVKEEYKHMEGDPQVKGKIKEKQRQMAQQRMMAAVPTADVIVRNPTHFAIALRYDVDKDDAPILVAKGQDNMAFRIIAIAEENGIPMTENPSLARALYKSVEVNSPIRGEFFVAVAEIMAWVYALKNKK